MMVLNAWKIGELALAVLVLASCDQNVAPPGTRPSGGASAPQSAAAAAPRGGESVNNPQSAIGNPQSADSVAGVTWTAPARWTSLGPRPMRAATYRVPAAAGDTEGGECAVFFFGAGQGGDVDANLKRWYGQFEQPGGGSSEKAAKTARQSANGLNVTTVDLSGTYLASAGPMSGSKESKAAFRLLGAIVEAPQGAVFFKLTGPAKTIAAAAEEFRALVKSLRKQ